MSSESGRFRVYRVVEAVPHINLQAVETPQLYTVFQSGYDELQETVAQLQTGDLVDATVTGDPDAESEPWRLTAAEQVDQVAVDFAVDVSLPSVAVDCWDRADGNPASTVLLEDETPVGACCVQPREPLPEGQFVPNVLAGLLPLEEYFTSVPGVGEPAVEALFVDADLPDADSHSAPFGAVLLFTAEASEIRDEFYDRYDVPSDTDTRPAYDPYRI